MASENPWLIHVSNKLMVSLKPWETKGGCSHCVQEAGNDCYASCSTKFGKVNIVVSENKIEAFKFVNRKIDTSKCSYMCVMHYMTQRTDTCYDDYRRKDLNIVLFLYWPGKNRWSELCQITMKPKKWMIMKPTNVKVTPKRKILQFQLTDLWTECLRMMKIHKPTCIVQAVFPHNLGRDQIKRQMGWATLKGHPNHDCVPF